MTKLIHALTAAAVSLIGYRAVIRQLVAVVLEAIAFLAIAVLLAAVTAPVWALIPLAVWCLFVSISLSPSDRRHTR